MKNIKKKRNLLLFGGEIQNLGGEISPPKGPEKNTAHIYLVKPESSFLYEGLALQDYNNKAPDT